MAVVLVEDYLSSLVGSLVGDNGSVYDSVKELENAPEHKLTPGGALDLALGRLVGLLQGKSCASNFAESEKIAFAAIMSDDQLMKRAGVVRQVAQRAEGVLESHFAKVLMTTPCPNYDILKEQSEFVERVEKAASAFPYIGNYVHMMEAEAAVMRVCVEWCKKQKARGITTNDVEERRLRLAFCGSGPLPFTGLLLSAVTGAAVTLIDVDPAAIDLSRRLVDRWVAAGVLPKDSISYLCADAADVQFSSSYTTKNGVVKPIGGVNGHSLPIPHPTFSTIVPSTSVTEVVRCDIIFVASLVPTSVKASIAQNMCNAVGVAPPVLLVRSAHGLTSLLAYCTTPRTVISRYLDFVGAVVPTTHVDGVGHVMGETESPLGLFPEDILNSLEIYCCPACPDTTGTEVDTLAAEDDRVRGDLGSTAMLRCSLVSALGKQGEVGRQ